MSKSPRVLRIAVARAKRAVFAILILPLLALSYPLTGGASTVGSCEDPTPYMWLPKQVTSVSPIDSASAANLSQRKASLKAGDSALKADLQQAAALSTGLDYKMQLLNTFQANKAPSLTPIDQACGANGSQRGSLWQQFQQSLVLDAKANDGVTSGVDNGQPFAWLNYPNQQGQSNGYYCGPATVAESSKTEGVPVSQATAASYMGTTSASGTSASQLLTGLQHYVGYPVVGASYYLWVTVSDSPTQAETTSFRAKVVYDINFGMTLAGDAYEVGGYYVNGQPFPHLVGHPNQTIKHWFEVVGYDWGVSQIYYADSATTIWSTVPKFSWIDQVKLLVILGGLGYIW